MKRSNACRWGRMAAAIGMVLVFYAICFRAVAAEEALIELTNAIVVASPDLSRSEDKAVVMLIEEIEKRTQVRLPRAHARTAEGTPAIVVGPAAAVKAIAGKLDVKVPPDLGKGGSEGYRIWIDRSAKAPVVFVAGADSRGVLFGVGRLLRALRMEKHRITLPADFQAATAPQTALRGHQLGYRPKTNSYDGWTVAMWEQYIRDLAVFGCNAIELIPPRSDDAADSPHFPLPQMPMMIEMSRLADEYGLDVWIWYPAMDRDYSDPETIESAIKKWGEVFQKLPRVDAVFVPGGDPGHTQPKYLMALLEKQTASLRRFHPKTQMWVSPQSFTQEWMNEFLAILRAEPQWLAGVVYGPQVRMSLAELRAAVPAKYPIRDYPDITHSRHCQYPVPDWDFAFALTEGREIINPRPTQMARIFRLSRPHTIGFICYSEGCNDDVNKAVWSALGWDPSADVSDILRDYSRYYIGPHMADSFAQGLLALERNWQGPVLTNHSIDTTVQQFQAMERAATPPDKLNWRFQMALYRAYYDAYVRARLIHETHLEQQAMEKLRAAREAGSLPAMQQAEAILDRAVTERVAADWRARLYELAEALYQSIRMQLSVPRYRGMSGRGNNLDDIDVPLNNRLWLEQRLAEIRKLDPEATRLDQIDEIVDWTNPGPGGFYDDLGHLARQPHLVRGVGWEEDPGFYRTNPVSFGDRFFEWAVLPISWCNHVESLYDLPLRMRYTGLDKTARYKLRVVYASYRNAAPVRLVADESFEVHPYLKKVAQRLEFDIAPEATADGELNLTWYPTTGLGGNGRSLLVAEVWLIKTSQGALSRK